MCDSFCLLFFFFFFSSSVSDEVIRENPASRGTETSAEVLVGPPVRPGGWMVVSNAGHDTAVVREK